MKIGVFSTQSYDRTYLFAENQKYHFDLTFLDARLCEETAGLMNGFDALCVFVNDILDSTMLDKAKAAGVGHIALRCAGFNNIDIQHAHALGLSVSRVPAYSPESVAEHTFALMMALNRKTHKAHNRIRDNNFNLTGLMGFNFHGKILGIVGTGKIGKACARIALGFGCKVICYDLQPDPELTRAGCEYVSLDVLLRQAHIITLHVPLTADNQYMINDEAIASMRDHVMLINTSRGGLVDTHAVIRGLKTGKIGYLGLDVYEMESELFFQDLSGSIIQDDVFERLSSFPNVLITGHQGFFTREAMQEIASTTLENLASYQNATPNPDTFL